MKNEYKRSDIFLCSNQSHAKFNKKVSVYHVLKVKKCFPQGCVYFYWRCKKINKGESCPRRYQHVGRKCFGCKEFYDIKVTNQLKVAAKNGEWERFQENLANFEEWLASVRGRKWPIYGEVDSVKPHLEHSINTNRLLLKGFILTFKECYIDRIHFEDFAFARIATRCFQQFRFSPGDRLDFLATVIEDRGRILFTRVHRIEFSRHQPNPAWSDSQLQVTLSTATEMNRQMEKCYYCSHGVLVDSLLSGEIPSPSRRMICLAGVKDPISCVIPAFEFLSENGCPPR